MRFCKHRWYVVKRTFNPPTPKGAKGWQGMDSHEMMMLHYGFTNIEQRCDLCGKVIVEEAVGNAESGTVVAT